RRLQGLLLYADLGELDVEDLAPPLEGGLLEGLHVLPRAGELRLPVGEILLLAGEAPLLRAGLLERGRDAVRLPGEEDRGRLHLRLPLLDRGPLRFEGPGEGRGLPLPPLDVRGLRLDRLVAGLHRGPLPGHE